MIKNPSANAGDIRAWVNPWIGKIPLEEGMATHSNILAWRIPWTEALGRLPSIGHKESDMTEGT